MTDRAGIERLLQMMGRTLEGLPELYDDIAVKKRIREVAGSYRWAGTSALLASHSLHQSDVIELLVGALRDALEKPMQKPLTLEELKTEPCDSYVWEERRTNLNIYFERTSALVLAFMCVNSKEDMYKYGSSVRAWKKMPTDEEREAAAWEV